VKATPDRSVGMAVPRRLAAALLLGLSAIPAPAQQYPAPQSLSLEEAIAVARESNPSYLQQRSDLGVARSQVRSAYGNLLPSLTANAGLGYTAAGEARFGTVGFGTQPDNFSSDYSVGMNLSLSGANLLQPSVQRAQQRATESRVEGAAWSLEQQVVQQYLTVLQAREQVAQAERDVARTGEHVRLAEAQLEVGSGTPLDVRRAEVNRGQAQVNLVQMRNSAEIAALVLGQLLGVPLDPSVQLTSEFSIFSPRWRADDLVSAALRENPVLVAAHATREASETGIQVARSTYLPTLNFSLGVRGSVYQAGNVGPLVERDLFGMAQQFESCRLNNEILQAINRQPLNCGRFDVTNPAVVAQVEANRREQNRGWPFDYNRQPLTASISVGVPIFQGFSRQLQVDQARAAASDAYQEVRAQELRLRQEVHAADRNVRAAYETALLQEQVRQNAAEELRLARERFRFGAANSIEVTDAQNNLARAEQAQIDAVYVFHKSLAALEALVGQALR
jgi:outer membrane protein